MTELLEDDAPSFLQDLIFSEFLDLCGFSKTPVMSEHAEALELFPKLIIVEQDVSALRECETVGLLVVFPDIDMSHSSELLSEEELSLSELEDVDDDVVVVV